MNLHDVLCEASSPDEHRHVIWEHDGRLCRDTIRRSDLGSYYYSLRDSRLTNYGNAYIRLVGLAGDVVASYDANPHLVSPPALRLRVKGFDITLWVSSDLNHLWHRDANAKDKVEEEVANILGGLSEDDCNRFFEDRLSPSDVYTTMEAIADTLIQIKEEYGKSKAVVFSADQLFIAVSGVWK